MTTKPTPKVPEKLLDKYRYTEVECDCWSEVVKEDFIQDMADIGIGIDKIYYSISYSQGDGACFEGYIEDWGKYLEHLGYAEDHPQHRHLHQLATDSEWNMSWYHTGMYCHEHSVYFDADLILPDDNTVSFEEVECISILARYCPYRVDDLRARVWWIHICKYDADELEAEIKEDIRRHMRDLYQRLVAEFKYLTSDEVVAQSIIDNDLLGEEDE